MKKKTFIEIKKWVNNYSDELYSWALYKTSIKEVAEDLVQETFIIAFEKIDSFNQNSTPKTWLFSILNHKIIDYYRKKTKNLNISSDAFEFQLKATDNLFDQDDHWKEPSEITELNWLDNPEFNNILKNCIEGLPNDWQFIIKSKYILDKKGSEICQELEISSSNYWQIVHRVKLLLKTCIDSHWNP